MSRRFATARRVVWRRKSLGVRPPIRCIGHKPLIDIRYDQFMRSLSQICFWLMVSLTPPIISAAAEPLPRSVLIITQSSPSSAGAVAMFDAISAALNVGTAQPVTIYTEHLDLNRFPTPRNKDISREYIREKYRGTPIGVVVVDGPLALDFVLGWRGEIGAEIPVVFSGFDELIVDRMKVPLNVTGFAIQKRLGDMVRAARVIVPDLKRIALVGDPFERDAYRSSYKRELAVLATELDVLDFTGLSMIEIRRRVAALPDDTAVLYTAIFVDGAGAVYTPQSALVAVAKATNRPIVIDVESQLGYGGVGGFIDSLVSRAQETARLATRILDGESASQIPVAKVSVIKPIFDWRELQRWGISEARLPPGSEVRFREATAWERYSNQIVLIAAALLIQTTLIIALFHERRHRRNAEATSRSAIGKLAHMNQVATAGELSASIAHEVNQPLAAIVTNANAALRWLKHQTPDLDEVSAALNRVVSAGHRASEVIGSVRAMFKNDSQQKTPVDLNALIQDVLGLLHGELQTQGILVQTGLSRPLPLVLGHNGQLQQVVLNLIRNAADAMAPVSSRARVLGVKTAVYESDGVLVLVEDSGMGIDPKNLERIFESFFTTKSQGMGMGLSICRSIIEAHDGKLWASSGTGRGSIFNIQLPVFRPRVE
jgi:signal transduction histidine kinase